MTRIARVKIPHFFTDLKVEPTTTGARLVIGDTHVPLSRTLAVALADALVDAAEQTTPDPQG
ncbi:MAG: hypothetical protein U1C73_12940 [Dietzia sp.]|nr:hypothetical protein [Dietzia sp.]